MERIRRIVTPEIPGKSDPVYLIPSIDELANSRDALIGELLQWERLAQDYGPFSGLPSLDEHEGRTNGKIYIPQMEHRAEDDSSRNLSENEIIVRQGISTLRMNLPSQDAIEKINKSRKKHNQNPLSIEQLRDSWKAGVALLASFSDEGDRFTIIDVDFRGIPAQATEKSRLRLPNFQLAPSPA